MKHILTIASKELRSFFNSAVALIFLATFLGVVLFTLFWMNKFFARNIADIRPMFEWFPLLLIFLVAALTMRMWSEEQKLGTLEVLLTLPVSVPKLVLGKFVAGLLLVTLALGLTLGIPITVSMMGNLDWGPVFGGYFGALLLASAYLSIGLCISSVTENQVLALIFTVLACLLLYLPGADAISGLFGYEGAELMRQLGTGSRFQSVARGVIDIRDIMYYAGIIALFLVLNAALLHAKSWSRGRRTWRQRFNVKLAVGLVLLNVVAANLWLAPVNRARIDLTENGEYSLSPVTKKLLRSVDEPLLLRAYISHKTHPLVAPLVPEIRDLLTEYGIAGGKNVRVEFVDPLGDDKLEKEAEESYGIDAIVFKFEERNQSAWVNSYFSLLIKHGDQFEVLNIMNLLQVEQRGIGDVEVRLGNLEYDVTRSIKKVVEAFQNKDRVFENIPASKITLTAYLTPDNLPENLKEVPKRLETIAKDLEKQSRGKFEYTVVQPTTKAQQQDLYRKYGLQPYAASILSNQYFYMHLVLDVGGKLQRIMPPDGMKEADIRKALTEALRRVTPGYMKRVGLWAPKGFTMPANPQMGGQPRRIPPAQGFQTLKELIRGNFDLRETDLASGHVSDDIDMLLIAGPEKLTDKAQYAVDQFLMRGGTVLVLAGRFRLQRARDIKLSLVDTGLEELLKTYGIQVENELVLDTKSEDFAIPEVRQVRGRMVQRIRKIHYPFFIDVRRGQMAKSSMTRGVPAVILQYASPVHIVGKDKKDKKAGDKKGDDRKGDDKKGDDKKGDDRFEGAGVADLTYTPLLTSSKDAWTQAIVDIAPNFQRYPDGGFAPPPEKGRSKYNLAVLATGTFVSHFKDKGEPGRAKDSKKPDQTIKRSAPGARLVVVGSSVFVSDEGRQLSRLASTQRSRNNFVLIQNIMSWAMSDADLQSIRVRGGATRTLEIGADERTKWEWVNYGIVIFALFGVAGIGFVRRRMLSPMELLPRDEVGFARDEEEEEEEDDDPDDDDPDDDDPDDDDPDDDGSDSDIVDHDEDERQEEDNE